MKTLTERQARDFLAQRYGVFSTELGNDQFETDEAFFMIADYRDLPQFESAFCVAVYSLDGEQMIDRFNIARA